MSGPWSTPPLHRTLSEVDEAVSAFLGTEKADDLSGLLTCGLDGSGLGVVHEVFELDEDLFDGVQARWVGRWKIMCASLALTAARAALPL